MARSAIPTVTSTTKGVILPAELTGDATNNHYLQNSGREKVHIRNSNGAATARTVTIRFNTTVDGQGVTAFAKAIAAGDTQVFGPFDTAIYGTQVQIDVDNAELKLRAVA